MSAATPAPATQPPHLPHRPPHALRWLISPTLPPLRFWAQADAGDLPLVHTCSHEVRLPAYPSREVLRAKLMQAVEHRHDGFNIE